MNDGDRAAEAAAKLAWMRAQIEPSDAVRLRGVDWFAWATAGGSNVVLLAAETGVAEVLVTGGDAFILTDEIEAERLRDEEVPAGFDWHVAPWAEPEQRERFVREAAGGGRVFSDRPGSGEVLLPASFRVRRQVLSEPEQSRYRDVGRRAAQAMSDVLRAARPAWSEWQLAGAGAEALWGCGLHPALTLAAGAARLPRYRHPTPSGAPLGDEAMLVFCARGFGLYANLTRFVRFRSGEDARRRDETVRAVEAAGLQACRPGRTLADVYQALADAYREAGVPDAIREHHQGGITGYLAREIISTPATATPLETGMAVALNPSLPGTKIEDTFLLGTAGLENLTLDSAWPSVVCAGRPRPLPLEGE